MLKALEGRSLYFWSIASILLVGILGIVDYQTGTEYSFYLFYLLPIFLTTWYANPALGLSISFMSALSWLVADITAGEGYSHPVIYFWNTLIRFGFFIIVTYLISELQKAQKSIQSLAQTDYITGVANSRYFHELLRSEINRSSRYLRPFTLMYLDLDNFKQVNDRFGHNEGDQLIAFIANEVKQSLRNTDIISRLGGDEFSVLFPETGQQEAEVVISYIFNHLTEQLRSKYPFLTLSAGVVTYISTPASVEETIKIVDELMYSVKDSTKNGIRYSLYNG